MSKFLDKIESFSGPSDIVLFRAPLSAEITWDVDDQKRISFGRRYRISVNLGAEILAKGDNGIGSPMRQMRKLMAREVYGEFDEIKDELIQLQMKLYNTPDIEAQNMATDINFLLIKINKATS